MKNWKRNVVVATVLVFVCAGVYLNWAYNQKQQTADLTDTIGAQKVMGDGSAALGETQAAAQTEAQDETQKEQKTSQTAAAAQTKDALVSAAAKTDGADAADYFSNVRLSRQQARDSAVKTLQEAMAYQDGGDTSEASVKLNGIVTDALRESQIESLVIAKGYQDCVAYINDNGISVAVSAPADGLKESDVALIADAVTSQTDYKLSQIHVVEVK
jgi:stage III sporulation protein AH